MFDKLKDYENLDKEEQDEVGEALSRAVHTALERAKKRYGEKLREQEKLQEKEKENE